MGGLDYFAFIVMAVLLGAGIWAAVVLGALPGRIAEKRGHPQADAIRVAGWFGLLTLGLLWPLALIWAYTRSPSGGDAELRESLDRLTERVTRLEATGSDPATRTSDGESSP
jgi:hypothetical protein